MPRPSTVPAARSLLLISQMTETAQDEITDIQRELDELRDQIATLEADLEEKPDYGMGKGDPAVTRWELDQAMLERLQERAASLERSLSQMDQGTYGICERCGERINPDRLAVLPDTKLCIDCAQSKEHRP